MNTSPGEFAGIEIFSFEGEEIVVNGLWLLRTIIGHPYFFLLDPRFLSESGSFYGESKLGNLGKSGTEVGAEVGTEVRSTEVGTEVDTISAQIQESTGTAETSAHSSAEIRCSPSA